MSNAAGPEPLMKSVRVSEEEITGDLRASRTIRVPLAWSWRLSEATPERRATVRVIGSGEGADWPDVGIPRRHARRDPGGDERRLVGRPREAQSLLRHRLLPAATPLST
jgi:hypothetical protein